MQKVNLHKIRNLDEKPQVCIRGITGSSSYFSSVPSICFYFALANLRITIQNDTRLLETHQLQTFHLLEEHVPYYRTYGIKSNLLGYIYKEEFFINNRIYNPISHLHHSIQNYDLENIKSQMKIVPFIQKIEGIHASKK